jgi:NTP pyrophosphatase (non-canonical NTP hydrolase)
MKDYIQNAIRTESSHFDVKGEGRLLHAGMGLVTESAEFLDALKKSFFYGKELDKVNLKEELGDIMWYMAVACDVLGTDFETEMKRNIDKLSARYPEKFESHLAENRNLDKERKILETEGV